MGLSEGAPRAKVIDFGIAKAAGPRLTEKTLFTSQGMLVGTPAARALRLGPLTAEDAPFTPSTAWQEVQLSSGSSKSFRPLATSPSASASFSRAAT